MGSRQSDMLAVWKARDLEEKEKIAIELIQAFEPDEPYYVGNSGGKDSSVTEHLVMRSGVKYQSYYCVSPIDPKEVHQFIRKNFPDTIWEYYARGFWNTVVRKGLPMRTARWCCEIIKEAGGVGRLVILGNRRQEGAGKTSRGNQQCFEKHRKLDKFFLRPILYWSHEEVWSYIRKYNLPYNYLYDEGCRPGDEGYGDGKFKRLGCVLCPFTRSTELETEYFPKLVAAWKRVCDRIVADRQSRGGISKRGKPYKQNYKTGQELFDWWIKRD